MNCFIIIVRLLFFIVFLSSLIPFTILAQEKPKDNKDKNHLNKSLFTPDHYALLNINNLTTWQKKDGKSNHSPQNKEGGEL